MKDDTRYKTFNLFWQEINDDELTPDTRGVMIWAREGKQYKLMYTDDLGTVDRNLSLMDIPRLDIEGNRVVDDGE